MGTDLLRNGGFEADWQEDSSHRCLVLTDGAAPSERDVGNVFTPAGWTTWFRHRPGTWDQPEVRDAHVDHDPRRVHSGRKGTVLFTFFRKHDGGFLQQVQVGRGTRVRLSGWAHAWSNSQGREHTDDPLWSEGPGYDPGFLLEGDQPPAGSPGGTTDWQNFTFLVGIDPTGGLDPLGATVVWGRGAHIYNQYAQPPSVEVVAEADTVTVFLRSKTLWAFKHNDAYWDDAVLTATSQVVIGFEPAQPSVGENLGIRATVDASNQGVGVAVTDPSGAALVVGGPAVIAQTASTVTYEWVTVPQLSGVHSVRLTADGGVRLLGIASVLVSEAEGAPVECVPPRIAYARVYVLLPQDAGPEWVQAVLASGRWEKNRWTVGCSADDAGVGPQQRTVIAINPNKWGDLKAFFNQYYPGVKYVSLGAATPNDLVTRLRDLVLP